MQSTLLEKNLKLDFDWLQLRHKLKDSFVLEKLPDLNAVLLFIGIQKRGKARPHAHSCLYFDDA